MYITKNNSKNQFSIAGHVSKNFIKHGQFGPFGMFIVAVDDGYYSKKESKYIDRTQFISVDVGKIKDLPELNIGDYVDIDGKFELEQWEDKQTQKPRSEVKLKAMKLSTHIPADICKMLKEQGFVKPPKQGQPQGGQQQGGYHNQPPQQGGYHNQPPQQGGYHNQPPQQGGYQNQPPQQGGYQNQPPQQGQPPQQQRGGYAQQRGGYAQPPQQGGYPDYSDM